LAFVGASALAGLATGIAAYFFLRGRHEAGLRELSTLIEEMGNEAQQANVTRSHGVTDNALSLLDKIMVILPEIVRKRNQDSFLFGAVAFLVVAIAAHSLAISVLVGAMTWLYFRYETRKMYEREIRKLEEQRGVFEQQKKDLLETLSVLP
jgi:Flp pilus assembly protein TadB